MIQFFKNLSKRKENKIDEINDTVIMIQSFKSIGISLITDTQRKNGILWNWLKNQQQLLDELIERAKTQKYEVNISPITNTDLLLEDNESFEVPQVHMKVLILFFIRVVVIIRENTSSSF